MSYITQQVANVRYVCLAKGLAILLGLISQIPSPSSPHLPSEDAFPFKKSFAKLNPSNIYSPLIAYLAEPLPALPCRSCLPTDLALGQHKHKVALDAAEPRPRMVLQQLLDLFQKVASRRLHFDIDHAEIGSYQVVQTLQGNDDCIAVEELREHKSHVRTDREGDPYQIEVLRVGLQYFAQSQSDRNELACEAPYGRDYWLQVLLPTDITFEAYRQADVLAQCQLLYTGVHRTETGSIEVEVLHA